MERDSAARKAAHGGAKSAVGKRDDRAKLPRRRASSAAVHKDRFASEERFRVVDDLSSRSSSNSSMASASSRGRRAAPGTRRLIPIHFVPPSASKKSSTSSSTSLPLAKLQELPRFVKKLNVKKSRKSPKRASASRKAARRGTKTAVAGKAEPAKLPRRRASSAAVRHDRFASEDRFRDEENVAELFQKVISELMVRKDRRTSMQYIKLTSSPLADDSGSEISEESSLIKSTRPLFDDAKSGKSKKIERNNNLKKWAPLHRAVPPSDSSLSISRSYAARRSPARPAKAKRNNSGGLFLRGPEYANWERENAPLNGPTSLAVVPKDVQRNPEITGMFKSQLLKYQPKQKTAGKKSRATLEKYLEQKRSASGNEAEGWNSPIRKSTRDSSSTSLPQSPVSVEATAQPTPRKRSSSFAVTTRKPTCLERLDATSGRRFGVSQSMKRLGVAIPPPQVPPKEAKKPSSLPQSPIARAVPSRPKLAKEMLVSRPLPSSFSPLSFSTPLPGKVRPEMRRATSDSGIPPTESTYQPPARGTKSAFDQSVSVFRTPPTSSRPPWLVEAAKKMEQAQKQGKTAVLSTSLSRGRRSTTPKSVKTTPSLAASMTARSSSVPGSARSRLNTSSDVSSLEGPTPLSDVEKEEERKKFLHHKNVRLRLVVDHEKSIEQDFSINFESTKENPSIKVTDLLVDNHRVWGKGARSMRSLQLDGLPLSSHTSTSSSDVSSQTIGGTPTAQRATSPVLVTATDGTPKPKASKLEESKYQTPPSS